VMVAADGPDLDPDPDPVAQCPEAYAELTKGTVNILVPGLDVEKRVLVRDDSGTGKFYPSDGIPTTQVWLDENVVYPIEIYYTVTMANTGDVDLPKVNLVDDMLHNLEMGIPAGIMSTFIPNPWIWDNIILAKGSVIEYKCTVVCDDLAEATLLASNDFVPGDTDTIDNNAAGTQPISFTIPDVCGEGPEVTDDAGAKVHLNPPVQDIPALDWVGLVIMILTLGGLLIWRSTKG
ncbi:MAG: hypothetical protein ABIK28_10840, partial [Planctomycetota bacterium]